MKKVGLLILVLFFLVTQQIYAESSTRVNINNNVNSSNTSNSNIKSETNIRVETNGEVTEYHSSEPNQKIEVKSVNGQSEITVDGNKVTPRPTNEVTKAPAPTKVEPNDSRENEVQENANEIQKLIKDIKEKINNVGEIISSLFD